MEIETVYYRLWSEDVFSLARNSQSADIIKSKACCNIRDNNQAFLNELEKRKLDGYDSVWTWLEFLLEDYVKRNHSAILHPWNAKDMDYEYYYKWLYNTQCICGNDVTVIRFCKEAESEIEEISSGHISLDRDEEFKEFRNKVGVLLGKDETESLYRDLPSMKPKATNTYYRAHSKIAQYFNFKEFFEICKEFGHHEGEHSWTYDNAKRR